LLTCVRLVGGRGRGVELEEKVVGMGGRHVRGV